MIVTLLLVLLFGMLNAVFGLIPEFEIFDIEYTGTTGGALDMIVTLFLMWDLFVPILTCFLCIGAILAVKAFVAVAKLVVFVWDKIPFKSA